MNMNINRFKYESSIQHDNSSDSTNLIVQYRSNIRAAAKDFIAIFKLSDEVRDKHLFKLSIKLVDNDKISTWIKK